MSVDPSEGILALLAHDDADLVRMAVSGNHGTPIDVLRRLADDAEDEVRASLAANRATPVDVLRLLASDEDADVRAREGRVGVVHDGQLAQGVHHEERRLREGAVRLPVAPAPRHTS